MKVNQWEIVEVNFQMPNKRFLPHPALVISNNDLFEDEESGGVPHFMLF